MQPIEQLSRVEKLRMMEALWNDLSRDEGSVPSPAWHGEALSDAEAAVRSGDAEFIDWGKAKKILLGGSLA